MNLMYEDLARAQQAERLAQARDLRRGRQLELAARLNRRAARASARAERASQQARLLLARAL
jgi:hypothetical protein